MRQGGVGVSVKGREVVGGRDCGFSEEGGGSGRQSDDC